MADGNRQGAEVVSLPKSIGKYRIVRQLAQGGMAEIFLASASGIEGFEKRCVLKRILPILAGNKEFVEMFLDEARIAASLLHSNIAQVFDIGSHDGSYYFVMELLSGNDVRHVLKAVVERKELIPYEHVATIIMGVCAGLHYAHEMRGSDDRPLCIVHRDISPQNVFVTHDGNVKLCDFGIAKSTARLTETRVGTLKGKIRYMSPEQCQSQELDRRSDIFSLCILLWELITVRRLYTGGSDFDICKAIIETDAPLASTYRSDVPPALDAIVRKGLSRSREDRFQTAQELQLAIEAWVRDDRVPSSPVSLASFMRLLFGTAITNSGTFLDKVSEVDPLARRIRALNDGEPSASEVVTPPSIGSTFDGLADATAAMGKPATRPLPEHEVSEPASAESALFETKPPRRRWPAMIATLLVLAAVAGFFILRARPALPVPPTLPVAAPTPPRAPEIASPTLPAQPSTPIAAPIAPVAPASDLASHRRRHREDAPPKKTSGEPKTVSPSAPPGNDENSIKDPFAR
jgi:serine/threonine protein kinase